MSKIYDKFLELKKEDASYMYLFRSGNFYIFLGEDADLINNYVVLKRTNFCKETFKCGFPISSLDDYLKVFNNQHLKVKVVNPEEKNIDKAIEELRKINLDNITPIKALNILKELRELV